MADSAESIRHDDQQVEISVPQWKRELILRKRSHSKALGGPNSQICLSPPIHSGATSPGLSPASSGFNINIRGINFYTQSYTYLLISFKCLHNIVVITNRATESF